MAALTWRNVDAPNFSGSAEALRTAGSLLAQASNGLSDRIADFNKSAIDANSGQAIASLAAAGDQNSFRQALASGIASGAINPANLNSAAINYIQTQPGQLINNQGGVLANQGRGIANNAAQFNLDTAKSDEARKQGYITNQPAANDVLTRARDLMQTGDPAQIAQGRQLIVDNNKTLTAAGYNGQQQLDFQNGNLDAINSGLTSNENIIKDQNFTRTNNSANNVRTVIDKIVQSPDIVDSNTALKALDKYKTQLTAEEYAAAQDQISKGAQSFWRAPDTLDTLPNVGKTATQLIQTAGPNAPTGATNATPTFTAALDKYEGGGSYSTLFKNAQNNQFAGVDPSKLTIGQAIQFANPSGAYGQFVAANNKGVVATPLGRYQIVGSTLAQAAREMGLDPNTPFDAQTQDAIATHIGKQAISGPRTMAGKIDALRGQWVGLKNAPDSVVGQIVNELGGTNEPVPSSPLSPSQIIRNSVVAGGGYNTNAPIVTPAGAANGVLSGQLSAASDPSAIIRASVGSVDDSPSVTNVTNTQANQDQPTSAQQNQEALSKLKTITMDNGQKAYIDTNGNTFTVDANGTATQVDATGIPTGGTPAYQPQAITAANTPAPTQGPQPQPDQAATNIISNAATIANTGVVDQLNNNLGSLDQQLSSRPNRGESVADTVARLKKGPLAGVPTTAINDAVTEIMKNNNVDADVAGILAAQSPKTGTAGSWWGLNPFSDTRFVNDKYGGANPGEGLTTQRIDVDHASDLFKNYVQKTQNGASIAPGAARLSTAQGQQIVQQQVQQTAQQVTAVQDRINRLAAALNANPQNESLKVQLQQAQAQLQLLNSILISAANSGVTPYTKAQAPVPAATTPAPQQ
jgi:hypothetical protein